MHTSKYTSFWGVIHPHSALYEKGFNSFKLIEEHKKYISILESNGIEVLNIENILLMNVLDFNGNIIEGRELDELRAFAKKILKIDSSNLSIADPKIKFDYKDKIIMGLDPRDLVKVILLNPSVILSYDDKNTEIMALY